MNNIWTTPFDLNKQREGQATFGLPTSAIIVVSVNFRVFLCVKTCQMFSLFHTLWWSMVFVLRLLGCFVLFFFCFMSSMSFTGFYTLGRTQIQHNGRFVFLDSSPPPASCPSTHAIEAPAHSPLAHQTSTHAIRQWGHKGRRRKE